MYIPVYICKFIMFYDVENAGACQSICVIHLIKAIIETFINGSKNNEKQEKKPQTTTMKCRHQTLCRTRIHFRCRYPKLFETLELYG